MTSADLEIQDIQGIGPTTAKNLKEAGIVSVMDLAVTSADELAVDINASKESAAAFIMAAQKLLRDSRIIENVVGIAQEISLSLESFVAGKLNEDGLATLLLDLLTIDWIMNNPDTKNLAVGLFGASTGAAAALVAASERPNIVSVLVSRGGRPDLAGKNILRSVKVPTLLLVGGNDPQVLELNENTLKEISAEKKLTVIPGATHLFEEPGKLEQVARVASGWFRCYFLIKKHNG